MDQEGLKAGRIASTRDSAEEGVDETYFHVLS